MRTICIQLQAPWNCPDVLAAISAVVGKSKARSLSIQRGGKKRPYTNLLLKTRGVKREWGLLFGALKGNPAFMHHCIVTCTGRTNEWDDYEVLWHMDKDEIDPGFRRA